MHRPVIFDLDDFSEEIMTTELWKLLFELKKVVPHLRVTMFTVPLLCSESWLRMIVSKYPWIEMHYHGSNHIDRDEWLYKKEISFPFQQYFYRGFKAPWWRLGQPVADILNGAGYLISAMAGYFDIVADRVYRFNIGKCLIPNVAYDNGNYVSVHSHVQSQRLKDGLPDIFDEIRCIIDNAGKFDFVSSLG